MLVGPTQAEGDQPQELTACRQCRGQANMCQMVGQG